MTTRSERNALIGAGAAHIALFAALSIGWDWAWQSTPAGGGIVRQGLPRTNLLLVSDAQEPLPLEESLEVLARFIDAIDWQQPAWRAACNAPMPA